MCIQRQFTTGQSGTVLRSSSAAAAGGAATANGGGGDTSRAPSLFGGSGALSFSAVQLVHDGEDNSDIGRA